MTMPEKKLMKRLPAPVKAVAKKVPGGGGVTRPNGQAPAPTKKMAAAPAKAAPKAAKSYDEDDALTPADLRGGWTAAQETIDSTSTWAVTFKPATQTQVIKFLQQMPFASFRRHWIQRLAGRRAYTCLQSFNRDCPLCDVGDRASAVSAFNIAVCGDDGEATLRAWDCGVRITQTLKTFANDQKVGPLDKRTLYFAVSKTESTNRQQANTLVTPARERDLQEDYGIPPLTDDDIERLLEKAYTNEVIQMNTVKELQAVADELMNDDSGTTSQQSTGWGAS
jgi:hypothetical protein